MGTAKNQLMADEAYFDKAKEILLELGEIALCDKHPDKDYFYRTYKFEWDLIYKAATNKLKQQYPDMDDFTTFHAQIHEILNHQADKGNHCPVCEAVKND